MFSFNRKTKPNWNQVKYEHDEAIRRCYQGKDITLALCGYTRFLGFNWNSRLHTNGREPFVESDFQLRGAVHEEWHGEKHVLCTVEVVLGASGDKNSMGNFSLSYTFPRKGSPEEQELNIQVTLFDPTSMLKTTLIESLRDAALSGLSFIHMDLECSELTSKDLDRALSDMRERGYGSTRNILSAKMWPKIELQNAPAWARSP